MLIQISKRGVLRCVRDDGSVTWQKQGERNAGFFALHDLTHFAVESALEYQRGFFGLIAEGWDLEDTTGKGTRGPLPAEAIEVERIVGLLDAERGSGALMTAKEFGEYGARSLSEEDIARVRAKRAELFARWREVEVGGLLELTWGH
jgi:hypothetical protein